MATTHAPGTGLGPGDAGRHGRRIAIAAVIALAFAAIVAPFAARALDPDTAPATAASAVTTPHAHQGEHHRSATHDPALGTHADVPSLLPSRAPALQDGLRVDVGEVTIGALRRTPSAGWQVVVRWNGRLQPLPLRGDVALGTRTSWVARDGLLYTRVPTETPGRFRVYGWAPDGGSAYTPPTLVATDLGAVCFNPAFTAYGNCS